MIDKFLDFLIARPVLDKIFWIIMCMLVMIALGGMGYILDMAGPLY